MHVPEQHKIRHYLESYQELTETTTPACIAEPCQAAEQLSGYAALTRPTATALGDQSGVVSVGTPA
jgi:hypothetical protein